MWNKLLNITREFENTFFFLEESKIFSLKSLTKLNLIIGQIFSPKTDLLVKSVLSSIWFILYKILSRLFKLYWLILVNDFNIWTENSGYNAFVFFQISKTRFLKCFNLFAAKLLKIPSLLIINISKNDMMVMNYLPSQFWDKLIKIRLPNVLFMPFCESFIFNWISICDLFINYRK